MVVCKFFQQGHCRYGQSCRFEHVYSSKYSYHASSAQLQQNHNSTSGVTDEQLVNQVQTDIQSALKGKQWFLSCYAPFTEKTNFPGISDVSPDETRLFIYEAKTNNNLEQAVAFMQSLFQEGRRKYEALLQPTPEIVKTLRSLYRREACSSPFATGQNSGNGNASATSIFRSAAQSSSVFGQNSNQAQSIFAQANKGETNTAAKSIFAQASHSVFGNSQQSNQTALNNQQAQAVFGSSQQTSQSNMFGGPQPNSFFTPVNNSSPQSLFTNQNAFNTQVKQNSPSSIFASATQQASSTDLTKSNSPFASTQMGNIFQSAPQPSNVFGGNMSKSVFDQQISAEGSLVTGVYSKEDELSADDLEAFKSEHFTLGFVPEVPPIQSLCH